MEDSSKRKLFDSVYNTQKVVELLGEAEEGIRICDNKHVIILCGVKQTGKSTTINALLYGALEKNYDDDKGVTFSVPAEVRAKMKIRDEDVSDIGNGLEGCTKNPKGYAFPFGRRADGTETVLLDTRGFFDDRSENEEAACSLLMASIVKRAKSISLVIMMRCDAFMTGPNGNNDAMRSCGRVIGEILNGKKASVMYLFNNYRPQDISEYERMPKDPAQFREYVIAKMRKQWEKIVLNQDKRNKELVEKLAENARKFLAEVGQATDDKSVQKAVVQDEKYKKMEQDQMYLSMLATAFSSQGNKESDDSCYLYIDPASIDSINELRTKLLELPSVPKDKIFFRRTSDSAKKFERQFSEAIPKFLCLLQGMEKIDKFPSDVTAALIRSREEIIAEQEKDCELVLKGADSEKMSELEKKYGENVFSKEAEKVNKRLGIYKQDAGEIESEIHKIENAEPVMLDHDEHDESGPEVYKAVDYVNNSVPFKVVLRKKDPGTRIEDEKISDHCYHAVFCAGGKGNRYFRTGTGIVGGVASLVATILKPDIAPAVAQVVPSVNSLVDRMTEARCSFRVEYMAESKDIPENVQSIKRWQREANHTKEMMDEELAELGKIKQAASSSLKDKIKLLQSVQEKEKAKLELFERFRAMVLRLREKYQAQTELFYRVACVLFDRNQRNTNTADFIRLFEEQMQRKRQGEGTPSISKIAEHATIDDFDVEVLCSVLQEHFIDKPSS